MKKAKTKPVYRSAISGKFVSKEYTKKKPRVTLKQKVRIGKQLLTHGASQAAFSIRRFFGRMEYMKKEIACKTGLKKNIIKKEVFNREIALCRQLSKGNKGKCGWGKCKDCGVIPFFIQII